MFSKIIVTTDVSKTSDVVVDCLGGLCSLGAEEAVLVYAVGLGHLQEMAPLLAKHAGPSLAEQKAAHERQGFSTTVEIAPSVPMFAVNRLAKERGASLIVVGSQGLFMGSVNHGVAMHSGVTLLLIPAVR